jgi:hypothetical protein
MADIARLDTMLKQLDLPSVSTVPEKLIAESMPAAADKGPAVSPTELILRIHAGLSQVVAPATAQSLQVSEPAPGRHRFFGGMPLLVKGAAVIAVLSAVGFVMTSIPAAKQKLDIVASTVASSPTATPTPANAASPSPTPGVTR